MKQRTSFIRSPGFWQWLTRRLALILLIAMAIPGTYTFRMSDSPDTYHYFSASYILSSWNPLTYLTFALAAAGLVCTWLAQKFENHALYLLTAATELLTIWNMFRWCGIHDMMLERPIMLLPPILAALTAISASIAFLTRKK